VSICHHDCRLRNPSRNLQLTRPRAKLQFFHQAVQAGDARPALLVQFVGCHLG
jgi:hypothetical protein